MEHDWKEILGWFEEDPSKIEEPTEIIYADYDNGGYDGQAWVLFYDNGKFWYVEGGHCSCYGLEDQWKPEEYTPEALMGQVERATWGFFKDQKELIMAAIEKYKSPLSQLAAEYAQVDGELNAIETQYCELHNKRLELMRKKEDLKDKLREALN